MDILWTLIYFNNSFFMFFVKLKDCLSYYIILLQPDSYKVIRLISHGNKNCDIKIAKIKRIY